MEWLDLNRIKIKYLTCPFSNFQRQVLLSVDREERIGELLYCFVLCICEPGFWINIGLDPFIIVPSERILGEVFMDIICGLETGVSILWVPLIVAMITFLVTRLPGADWPIFLIP